MTAPLSSRLFDAAIEKKQLKSSRQVPESGYTGMGYRWFMYPAYVDAMSQYWAPQLAFPELPDQAQPGPDSKMLGAISEAGATTAGYNSGTSGTAAY